MDMLEQKEVTIGEKVYILRALPALTGLTLRDKFRKESMLHQQLGFGDKGFDFSPELKIELIKKGSLLGSTEWTDAKLNKHFSKNLKDLDALAFEVLKFNYDEFNDEGDEKKEQEDTSEK